MASKGLKEQVLDLRSRNLSYNKIAEILNCSKGTIAYHCGTGQIQKQRARALKRQLVKNKAQNASRVYLRELSSRYKKLCGCKVCKEKDPIVLQYDHRDRSLKLSTVCELINNRVGITLLKEEIRKCDVLCANCHLRKTAKEFNYSKF